MADIEITLTETTPEITVEIIGTGPQGPQGIQGPQGEQGIQGETGPAGADGADGQDGTNGQDGADGVSPAVTIASITGGHSVTITDADHPAGQTFNVMDGEDGQDGQDGQDGAPGVGVPSGGTAGQVLKKKSGTDYDTEWANESGGGGGTTEVFWATYGTTTSAQIETAYQAGKVCCVIYSDRVYTLGVRTSSTKHTFCLANGNTIYTVVCNNNSWSTSNYNLAQSANVPSAATATPSDLGTAAVGSSSKYAKEDHVHNKPTYTKSDVGLGNVDNVQQYSSSNPPPYPVSSVNGHTGAVSLSIPSTAADVGAIPAPTGGTVGQVLKKTANGQEWANESVATDTQVQDAVDDYLDGHSTIAGTFTNGAKLALLALLEKVAYIDGNGQDYFDALEAELFAKTVSSISAVFTQGQNYIYDTDSLDTLKQYLVVTATYSDSTTGTVNYYTLSGTLTVGTSTITVEYGGQTDTFNVTVTLDQASVFGSFTKGYACGKKINSTSYGNTPMYGVWNNSASARAALTTPVANNGYSFTVTDSNKYNIAVYGLTSNTANSSTYTGAVLGVYYQGDSTTPAFGSTGSTNASYLLLVLKKMDGTAFTDEELAHGAEAVFTYTESS